MKKALIFVIFIFSLFLVSCKPEDEVDTQGDKFYPLDNLITDVKMYEQGRDINEFGFYYGDYVFKHAVFISSIYSYLPPEPSNNDLAQGVICHFYEGYQYEYTLFNEFLDNLQYLFGWNYMENAVIENCVGVKDVNSDENNIYDFLLLVDNKHNIYLVSCVVDEDFEFNMLSVRTIDKLEQLNGYRVGSAIISSKDTPIISYEEFEEILPSINDDIFQSHSQYVKSDFFEHIAKKCATSLSGLFHDWYRIGDNYILHIYADNIYDNVVCELIYYENNVAKYSCKDINNFAEFIKGERYQSYFGKYLGNENDYTIIDMRAFGPNINFKVTTRNGYVRSFAGTFNISEGYLIVNTGTNYYESKLYFKLIENEDKIILEYEHSKSNDVNRPNSNEEGTLLIDGYQFILIKD